GARFAVVHGARCVEASNACKATVGDATRVIKQYGVGLSSSLLQLTFVSGGQSYSCNPAASCESNETTWPASAANAVGMRITIRATYRFRSLIAFLWAGQP